MDVTVVIPAGPPSRWHSLVRAVASARSQTHRPAAVIVVIDHDTEYFHRVRRDLPGVTVLENQHLSATGCLDTGAFHAHTELVAFLGHDVSADPGWLARLAVAFRDDEAVGAGGTLRPDWRNGRPRWLPDELVWTVAPNARPAGMMVRRTVFRQVGGFGRRRAELPMRMRALTGGSWRHVPDAVVRHEVPDPSFRSFLHRCFTEGRRGLRPLPNAALTNFRLALRARHADHALRGVSALAGMAAAAAGLVVGRPAGSTTARSAGRFAGYPGRAQEHLGDGAVESLS
ncbi:glycosyltransferase [Paractinoplanes globisporus]|uniref:Glycosyltransferase n=1 Tax=Paractinoplanes globisporus TaxID=113565 RepID=A0ABW6W5J8_9ACTN|nr:glycosyltransferase [Actinoplanes globisporus]